MENLQKQLTGVFEILQELSEKGVDVEGQLSNLQHLVPKIQGFDLGKYEQLFEENNVKGTKMLGWDWIKTNEKIIEVAQQFNLDVQNPVIRAFLTTIIVKLFENGR